VFFARSMGFQQRGFFELRRRSARRCRPRRRSASEGAAGHAAMQAFGLRTHAWNTALRSLLLLAGFPLLLALMALGLGMLFGAEQHDLGRAFANALRNLPWTYAACWVAALAWLAIAWMAQNRIMDWATGAQPVRAPRNRGCGTCWRPLHSRAVCGYRGSR